MKKNVFKYTDTTKNDVIQVYSVGVKCIMFPNKKNKKNKSADKKSRQQ